MPTADAYGVVEVEDIVTTVFGLEGKRRGPEFDMLCPNPDHLESKPSCAVNLTTGYWNCFSCGVGGDLLELGMLVLKASEDDVRAMLRPDSPQAFHEAIRRRIGRLVDSAAPKVHVKLELPDYPRLKRHPELTARGFSKSTIKFWDARWCEEQEMRKQDGSTYTITNSIALPIKDERGEILAWCYRSTRRSARWQPRYLYTPGAEISEMWYGLEHHGRLQSVTIVEGAFDAWWMTQCGFPALALLGSKMGDRKIMWLQRFKHIYTFPDYDNAGAIWQDRIIRMLGTRMPIYTCQWRSSFMKKRAEPDGSWKRASDPEELFPVDVELAHATAPQALERLAPKHHTT